MGQLKKAVEEKNLSQPVKGSLESIIKSNWHKIEAVMPKHMSGERLFQLAVSTINQNPKLARCQIATFLSCLMKCSALGLEPSEVDGLGRAYIIPYGNKATFILGYKGMLDLARRSGEIQDISARAVFVGDKFEYRFGLNEQLGHIPGDGERTPETLTHVYVVAHFKDAGHYIDVMTKVEIDDVRKRSKAGNDGPWVTDYIAMAIKSVIRRAFKFLPVSVEAQQAAAADETDGGFTQEIMGALPDGVPEGTQELGANEDTDIPNEDKITPETPSEARKAVCETCGNTVSDIAEDATLEDLNGFLCCDSPNYKWA